MIVAGVEQVEGSRREGSASYLASPTPDTVLALVAEELKPDSPLAKAVAKAGQVLAYTVAEAELSQWVAEQFKAAGVRAEPEACAALARSSSATTSHQLATEIDKLATWAGDEPIGEREVEALAAAVAETPTFALTDAWALRDVAPDARGERDDLRARGHGAPRRARPDSPALSATTSRRVRRVPEARRRRRPARETPPAS